VKGYLSNVPGGDAGTASVLRKMKYLVRKYKTDPSVLKLARGIAVSTGERDTEKITDAIYYWVKEHLPYVRDAWNVEQLASIKAALELRGEDCDGHTIAVLTLSEAVGIPGRMVACEKFGMKGFSHVYGQTWIRETNNWKSLDTTAKEPYSFPGYTPPGMQRYMILPVDKLPQEAKKNVQINPFSSFFYLEKSNLGEQEKIDIYSGLNKMLENINIVKGRAKGLVESYKKLKPKMKWFYWGGEFWKTPIPIIIGGLAIILAVQKLRVR